MKSINFIVIILFGLIGCSTQKKDNLIEMKLYDCVKKQYYEQNINIEEVLIKIEEIAIESKNLKDNSPESYYQMFKSFSETNKFPLTNEGDFFQELSELENFPVNMNCSNTDMILDSVEFTNSKINKFSIRLAKEIRVSTEKKSLPNIGMVIIDIYEVDDFKNDYIKYSLLSMVAYERFLINSLERKY